MVKKRPAPNPNLAVAYVRVSTDDQALSLEAQQAEITAWATRQGVTIASWHLDEDVSGDTPLGGRQGLTAALLGLSTSRAGALVVLRRDRLARDVVEAGLIEREVQRSHARIRTVDGVADGDTPTDALMRTMLDAMAEHERAMISMRTKAALKAKKARGERTGKVPYGYRLDADGIHLVPVQAELDALTRAHALRASGLTLAATAAQLDAEGHRPKSGKRWDPSSLYRVLGERRAS